jgi:hypothetical protein
MGHSTRLPLVHVDGRNASLFPKDAKVANLTALSMDRGKFTTSNPILGPPEDAEEQPSTRVEVVGVGRQVLDWDHLDRCAIASREGIDDKLGCSRSIDGHIK